jgi:hypothetical protein
LTLIASTLNYEMPFVISDLVWSGKRRGSPIPLPTHPPHDPLHRSRTRFRHQSVRMMQKMYIIADNTCIVFAGDSEEIQILLLSLKSIFSNRTFISRKNIDDFLQSYVLQTKFAESGFFIMQVEHTLDNSITVNQFHFPRSQPSDSDAGEGWQTLHHPLYEEVFACGTGIDDLFNVIGAPRDFKSSYSKGDFMLAVQTNLVLTAKLLALERTSRYTLRNFWGGGFETAFYNGKRLEKINHLTYVISQAYLDDYGRFGLPIPVVIMHYHYFNDILYILSLEAERYAISENDTFIFFTSQPGEYKASIFEVEGIDLGDIDDAPFPEDLTFTSNKVAMAYAFIDHEGRIYNPAFFNLGPEITVAYQQGKTLTITIDLSINRELIYMANQLGKK